MKYYFKALKVIFKYGKVTSFILCMLFIISGLVVPVQTFLLKKIIDVAIGTNDLNYMWVWIFLLVCVILFGLFQSFCQEYCTLKLRIRLSNTFEKDIIDHLNKIDFSYFEDAGTHDIINRFSNPSSLATEAYKGLLKLPQQIITLVGLAVLFYRISPFFVLGISLLFSISLYFNIREIGNLRKLHIKQTNTERKSNYISSLFVDRIASKEIRMFKLSDYLLKMYNNMMDNMINERNKIRRKGFRGGVVSQIMNMLFVILGILTLIYLALNKVATVSEVIALSTSLPVLARISSWEFPVSLSEFKRHSNTWEDYTIMMSFQELNIPENNIKIDDYTITLKDVHFKYPNTNKEILKGFNVTFKPNEKVAIVGRNGCGKSTLIKLILGLYPINSGQIKIGNTDIKDIPQKKRKELFSVIFQDFNIYNLSVRENIALSNINEQIDNKKIYHAAKTCDFYNVISKLPNGIDTTLGKLEESGVCLSGGENQRLALSRVIYSNSKYFIMDEPTAAMDPKAECSMYENLLSVINNRSCLIISHRLATAKMVDKVILIDDGVVAESGTHDELMKQNGLYARMFNEQASWYNETENREAEIND